MAKKNRHDVWNTSQKGKDYEEKNIIFIDHISMDDVIGRLFR